MLQPDGRDMRLRCRRLLLRDRMGQRVRYRCGRELRRLRRGMPHIDGVRLGEHRRVLRLCGKHIGYGRSDGRQSHDVWRHRVRGKLRVKDLRR